MGLSNAPAVFQSVMNCLFSPHLNKCVCIYLGDILVFFKTGEEHHAHLSQVLSCLRQHGLKAIMCKFDFFKTELKFLRNIVSSNGMKPDLFKGKVVVDWPTPQTAFEVRSFLGLANYFRKYIRGLAALVTPRTNLLKGLSKHEKEGCLLLRGRLPPATEEALKRAFVSQWTVAAALAFTRVKQALTSSPVLFFPDFAKPFEDVCDACRTPPAVGAVLLQAGRPVAYNLLEHYTFMQRRIHITACR
jgi:hypothetical protein